MTSKETKEYLVDIIALLNIPGVGKSRYWRLVKVFGSAGAVLAAPRSALEAVPDIGPAVAAAVKKEYDGEKARQTASKIIQLGWIVLDKDHTEYPSLLKNVEDAPVLLFRLGEAIDPAAKMIGIVGTRHPTEKGKVFAKNLARELVETGLVVVSGMAEGIDAVAHQGALEAGGKTVAVWGTSLDIIYPNSNRELAGRIQESGCIYSEYFPETKPDRAFFPERNRIISGVSEAVVVIEAGKKSGALITAEHAFRQGREVFAVPGHPTDKNSYGVNDLIKKGAALVTRTEDIFLQMPRLKGEVSAQQFVRQADLTDAERTIISALTDGPQQVDQLTRTTQMTSSEILEFLLALEFKGVVQEISGKRFILTDKNL